MSVASLQDLADVPGMNTRAAEEVLRFLHQEDFQQELKLQVAEDHEPYTVKEAGGEPSETRMVGKKHVFARDDSSAQSTPRLLS